VVDVLRKNQSNLDNSLRLLAPFYRVFTNTWARPVVRHLDLQPAAGRLAGVGQ
jgi:phospholipid/cholesterol/gamma-HCH transport system substrate-binding protein